MHHKCAEGVDKVATSALWAALTPDEKKEWAYKADNLGFRGLSWNG
jgi:hypothetical protein